MNRIARTAANLIVATGLATATLTFAATAAHAENPPAPTPGPVLGLGPVEPGHPNGPGDIKTPDPKPQPPKGPKNLGTPKGDPQPPKGPKDLADSPQEPVVDPKPAGPDAGSAGNDGQGSHHDAPAAPATSVPVDVSSKTATPEPSAAENVGDADSQTATVLDTEGTRAASDGHELAWILAGAGLGIGGLVLVAARRRKQADEA